MRAILIFSVFLTASASQSAIYDFDDRKDLTDFATGSVSHQVAQAVALVTRDQYVTCNELGGCELKTKLYSEYQVEIEEPLCEREPFRDHLLVESGGTGFLVAEDILVTAGHVLSTQTKCDKARIVFGFVGHGMLTESQVYRCAEIIQGVDTGEADYAVIRLDRPVKGREPLTFRKSGKIPDLSTVWMVGHPIGLSMKVTGGGTLTKNDDSIKFYGLLDTWNGNSGSPVFDPQTGVVEGILVTGESGDITIEGELLISDGCWYSKVYCNDASPTSVVCDDKTEFGAGIMRATVFAPYVE